MAWLALILSTWSGPDHNDSLQPQTLTITQKLKVSPEAWVPMEQPSQNCQQV